MSKIYETIMEIVTKSEKIVFSEANIYLITKEDLDKLIAIESELKAENPNKKNPLNKYAKIINTQVATKYNFYKRKTPRIITDPQKVIENIEKEFLLFKNVLLKGVEESIAINNLSERDAKELRDEVNLRIQEEKKILDEIINNYSNYEVIITNYENSKSYPAIHYTTGDGKHKVEHLSIRVPNFLYYEASNTKNKSTAKIKEFIKNSKLLGNTIYYKEKQ